MKHDLAANQRVYADEAHDDLVTVKPAIKDGYLSVPTGPGWGTEINEATVRAHPPRQR